MNPNQVSNDVLRHYLQTGEAPPEILPILQAIRPVNVAPPEETSTIGDVGRLFGAGAVNAAADVITGVEQLTGLDGTIDDSFRNTGQGLLNKVDKGWMDDINRAGFGEGQDLNARGVLGHIIMGGGSMLPFMIPGAAGARAISAAGKALGAGAKASQLAGAAGGYGLTGGAMIGGGTVNEISESIMAMDWNTLAQEPVFRKAYHTLVEDGADHETAMTKARESTASTFADEGFGKAFALGFVSNAVLGPALDKMFKGGTTFLKGAKQGAITEGLQEFAEEGGQALATNEQLAKLDGRDIWEGVGERAAFGAVIGAGAGSTFGGVMAKVRSPEDVQNEAADATEGDSLDKSRAKMANASGGVTQSEIVGPMLPVVGPQIPGDPTVGPQPQQPRPVAPGQVPTDAELARDDAELDAVMNTPSAPRDMTVSELLKEQQRITGQRVEDGRGLMPSDQQRLDDSTRLAAKQKEATAQQKRLADEAHAGPQIPGDPTVGPQITAEQLKERQKTRLTQGKLLREDPTKVDQAALDELRYERIKGMAIKDRTPAEQLFLKEYTAKLNSGQVPEIALPESYRSRPPKAGGDPTVGPQPPAEYYGPQMPEDVARMRGKTRLKGKGVVLFGDQEHKDLSGYDEIRYQRLKAVPSVQRTPAENLFVKEYEAGQARKAPAPQQVERAEGYRPRGDRYAMDLDPDHVAGDPSVGPQPFKTDKTRLSGNGRALFEEERGEATTPLTAQLADAREQERFEAIKAKPIKDRTPAEAAFLKDYAARQKAAGSKGAAPKIETGGRPSKTRPAESQLDFVGPKKPARTEADEAPFVPVSETDKKRLAAWKPPTTEAGRIAQRTLQEMRESGELAELDAKDEAKAAPQPSEPTTPEVTGSREEIGDGQQTLAEPMAALPKTLNAESRKSLAKSLGVTFRKAKESIPAQEARLREAHALQQTLANETEENLAQKSKKELVELARQAQVSRASNLNKRELVEGLKAFARRPAARKEGIDQLKALRASLIAKRKNNEPLPIADVKTINKGDPLAWAYTLGDVQVAEARKETHVLPEGHPDRDQVYDEVAKFIEDPEAYIEGKDVEAELEAYAQRAAEITRIDDDPTLAGDALYAVLDKLGLPKEVRGLGHSVNEILKDRINELAAEVDEDRIVTSESELEAIEEQNHADSEVNDRHLIEDTIVKLGQEVRLPPKQRWEIEDRRGMKWAVREAEKTGANMEGVAEAMLKGDPDTASKALTKIEAALGVERTVELTPKSQLTNKQILARIKLQRAAAENAEAEIEKTENDPKYYDGNDWREGGKMNARGEKRIKRLREKIREASGKEHDLIERGMKQDGFEAEANKLGLLDGMYDEDELAAMRPQKAETEAAPAEAKKPDFYPAEKGDFIFFEYDSYNGKFIQSGYVAEVKDGRATAYRTLWDDPKAKTPIPTGVARAVVEAGRMDVSAAAQALKDAGSLRSMKEVQEVLRPHKAIKDVPESEQTAHQKAISELDKQGFTMARIAGNTPTGLMRFDEHDAPNTFHFRHRDGRTATVTDGQIHIKEPETAPTATKGEQRKQAAYDGAMSAITRKQQGLKDNQRDEQMRLATLKRELESGNIDATEAMAQLHQTKATTEHTDKYTFEVSKDGGLFVVGNPRDIRAALKAAGDNNYGMAAENDAGEPGLAFAAKIRGHIESILKGGNRYKQDGNGSKPAMSHFRAVGLAKQTGKQLGVNVRAVKNANQLPDHVRDSLEADGAVTASGLYDTKSGDIYVITSNIADDAELVRVVLHEAVGHKGIRAVLKDLDVVRTLSGIYRDMPEGVRARLERDYAEQLKEYSKPAQQLVIAEEYVAHLAETDPKNSRIAEIVAKVKAWLRKRFPNLTSSMAWTEADAIELLRQSRIALKTGGPDGGGPTPGGNRYRQKAALEAAESAPENKIKDKPWSGVLKGARNLYGNHFDKLLATIGRRNLIDFAEQHMRKPIAAFERAAQAMQANTETELHLSKQLLDKWRTLKQADEEHMREVMFQATLSGVDPNHDRSAYTDEVELAAYDEIQKRWAKMTPEAKQIFNDVKKAYAKRRADMYKALTNRIKTASWDNEIRLLNSAYDDNPTALAALDKLRTQMDSPDFTAADFSAGLKGAGVTDAEIDRINERQISTRVLLDELRAKFEASKVKIYFPLMRFGRYWVDLKDSRGKRVEYRMFETRSEQADYIKAMRGQGFTIEAKDFGHKGDFRGSVKGVDPEFVAKVTGVINDALGPQGDKIADDVWQIYLKTMPDMSVRKQFIHRKGTLGFSKDAVRSFAHIMFHGAHQLSRLQYQHTMQRHIDRAKEAAVDADNEDHMNALVDEIQKRFNWMMEPSGSAWANYATGLGFFSYLGYSPAAALVNLFQTPGVALPIIAARFGWGDTSSQLALAGRQMAGKGRKMKELLAGGELALTKLSDAELRKITPLTREEVKAMMRFEEDGLISRTNAHSMAGVAEVGMDYNPKWERLMEWSSTWFHGAEVLNREVTALAVYRLARKKGADHEAAMKEAHEQVWKSHFDYSNANRPRIAQNDFAKVAFLFKQHSLNMSYRMIRDARDGFFNNPNISMEEKAEARRRLYGIIGMTGVFAGVAGMPMWWALEHVADALTDLGDDDEFTDGTTELRVVLTEALGPTGSQIVMDGLVNALTPADLSSRVGLNNLWMREPTKDLEGMELANHYLLEFLGPLPKLLTGGFEGYKRMDEGHTQRGLEMLMPKFARDLSKAWRFMGEGATNYKGEAIMDVDRFGQEELIAQALGFTPSELALQYDQNSAIKGVEQRILNRRERLANMYMNAVRYGDEDMKAEAWDMIQAMNPQLPTKLRLTTGDLNKRMLQRRKAALKQHNGVYINPQLAYLTADLNFIGDTE